MSFLRVVVVSIILLSSGCLGQGDGDLEFLGIEYRDPPAAPNFVLFAQNGAVFALNDHDGKVIVVACGYPAWPAICRR